MESTLELLSATVIEHEEWNVAAARDEARFIQVLADLGLDETDLLEEYRAFAEEAARRAADERRQREQELPAEEAAQLDFDQWEFNRSRYYLSLWIFDRFQKEQLIFIERKTKTVEVPLFRLFAPGPENSKATYRQKVQGQVSAGWTIKVLGIGTGADRTVALTESRETSAANDEALSISVVFSLDIDKIAVLKSGKKIAERVQLSNEQTATEYRVVSVPREANPQPELGGANPARWNLVDYLGANPVKESSSLAVSTAAQSNASFEIFNTTIGLQAKVANSCEVAIDLELPGEYNYTMRWLDDPLGIAWRLDTRRIVP